MGGLSAEARAYARWHHSAVNDAYVLEAFAEAQAAERLSPATIRNRHSILTSLATRAGFSLLELELRDLRRYLARDGIRPGTARTERNAMRAFYAFAVEDGYLEEDPTAKLAPTQVPRAEPRPFSAAHVVAMMQSGAYFRTRAMILVGWFQGFRVSQIARVRGDDFDLIAGTLRTVSKGGKERRVPAHPVILELASMMPPQDWWFPARDGTDRPIQASSVTDLITKAKKRAGITDPRLTPHSLRHGFASELVDADVDIRTIQELMLHEDISSTQIYTRVSERRKAAAIVQLRQLEIPEHSGRRIAA